MAEPSRGPVGLPVSSDERRDEALARLRSTYRQYTTSGYAQRWARRRPGELLAVAERDSWLAAAIGRSDTVLDLGCGDGGLARLLAALGQTPARYLGLDLLEESIAAARSAVPWGEFAVGSADRLPFPDGTADVVVMATLLSSLLEPFIQEAVATEIARVLRPGGRLVMYDIRYPSPRNRSVVPITVSHLERLFPGWSIDARTITLLPPIARSALGAGKQRYRWLAAIPWLRSHIAAVLVKP